VTLLIPVRAVVEVADGRISGVMTCADYREHPETLVEDCIQERQVLSLSNSACLIVLERGWYQTREKKETRPYIRVPTNRGQSAAMCF
jgi:hypothetical protein